MKRTDQYNVSSFTTAGKKINTYIASDWTNSTYFPGPISSYTCIQLHLF